MNKDMMIKALIDLYRKKQDSDYLKYRKMLESSVVARVQKTYDEVIEGKKPSINPIKKIFKIKKKKDKRVKRDAYTEN